MYQFAAGPQTSKIAMFFENIQKTALTFKFNETKVTLGNVFIVNCFALNSEKKSKNEKSTLFRDCLQILDLSVTLNKVTSRKDFIVNLFALESEKEPKNEETKPF